MTAEDPSTESAARREPDWLSPMDWALVRTHAVSREYEAEAVVVAEGTSRQGLYLITRGYARVERSSSEARIAIARLGPGDAFGEMSFLNDAPASASVVADEALTVCAVDHEALGALLEADPPFAARFFRGMTAMLSQRLRATSSELTYARARGTAQARRRAVSGLIIERQIPRALADAVSDFSAQIWEMSEALELGADVGTQAIVNAACNALSGAMSAALAAQHSDESRTDADDGHGPSHAFIPDPAPSASAVGGFVFRHVSPDLLTSATIASCRAHADDHGPDWRTVDRIYAGVAHGDGAVGPLIDRWFLSRPACQGLRESRRRTAAAIVEAGDGAVGSVAGILALSCRAPREAADALASLRGRIRVTLIDGDDEALTNGTGLVARASSKASFSAVNVYATSIASGFRDVALPPQRLIYGIGVADSIDDEALVRLLNWAYRLLEPGGTLLIDATDPRCPDLPLLEHVAGWHVRARNADELRALFARSRFGSHISLTNDEATARLWVRAGLAY